MIDLENFTPSELKAALAAPGRSQTGLARRLGVDASAVNRLVKGERRLRADEVKLVREYFDETADNAAGRLKKARQQAGLTPEQLAERCSTASSTVRAHESGQNRIRADVAATYATALGLDAGWLLYGTGEATAAPQRSDNLLTYLRAISDGGALPTEAQWARVLSLAGVK